MSKLPQAIKLVIVLIGSILLFTACSSKVTTANKQQKVHQSRPQKNIQIDLYNGDICQAQGLITIPVILNNAGINNTVISSHDFTLTIDGHKFKTFQVEGEPSDFHQDLASKESWSNIISFYLGTALPKSQLARATLTYHTDNDQQVKASHLTNSVAFEKLQNISISSSYTSVPDYYEKAKDYIERAKTSAERGDSSIPLKDQFQDDKYDRFRLWVVGSSSFPNTILVKAVNQTNTDLFIPFKDIEVEDKARNDIEAAPAYRNYNVLIPHGKPSQ